MRLICHVMIFLFAAGAVAESKLDLKEARPRARDIGLRTGILPVGPLNAITDVKGVAVGHATMIDGENVRTGVTVVLPHTGNLFREKVPGAVYVGNGFGKLAGSTQVNELGEIETPIALTSTLSVGRAADAILDYTLAQPGNEEVRSVNPLVGETNDARLNDVRGRPVTRELVLAAISNARGGVVEEGAIGAGTGTVAFGFKGGIGTSSRKLPATLGGYTVGVLVQSNFGGVLSIAGAPVGEGLGRYYLKDQLEHAADARGAREPGSTEALAGIPNVLREDTADGSIMMVVATDAPVDHRNLQRMAARAIYGSARTGSSGSGDSGDYVIAFSVAPALRITSMARMNPTARSPENLPPVNAPVMANDAMSPLFLAVIEATEEAIYNSLFRATTTTGNGRTIEALPVKQTIEILRRHHVLDRRP